MNSTGPVTEGSTSSTGSNSRTTSAFSFFSSFFQSTTRRTTAIQSSSFYFSHSSIISNSQAAATTNPASNLTDTENLNPPNCGQRPLNPTNKIVGGTEATPGDWGWQVLMLSNGRFIC